MFGTKGIVLLELWKGEAVFVPFEGERRVLPSLPADGIYPTVVRSTISSMRRSGWSPTGPTDDSASPPCRSSKRPSNRPRPIFRSRFSREVVLRVLELTGITWDHSRALPPLVATAQRYEELNPGVRIRWESVHSTSSAILPIDALAQKFDLIVIDHPWAGFCFARELVHDLAPLLTVAQRAELEQNSIGPSFESYLYEGKLLAIPIDAATPAPSYRPDLFEARGLTFPETWCELLALADAGTP